jgi:peptide/nickel transport system substrate-binding protein
VIGMLPAHLLSAVVAADLPYHEFTTRNPVGTGMFMVEEVSADRIVLVANPGYWGTRPYLERLEFWFYSDWDGLLEDCRRGVVQGLHPPGFEELTELEGVPGLQFYSAQSAGYALVYLNLMDDTLPFFEEKDVRQALLYALDRQGLVDQVLGGQGIVADSPILPTTWAYDSGMRTYAYDPERAIGLLHAAGWVDSDGDLIRDQEGVELAFTLLTSDDPLMADMAEEMSQQWRAVGVDATIRAVSSEAAIHFVRNRNFDAALVEIELTADPDPYPLWHSTQAESGQNFSGFASEESDLAMEEARRTVDPAQRLERYSAFQRSFAEEVPSLLIYYPIYVYAVDSQVRGVQLSPLLHTSDRFRNIHEWYYVEMEEMPVSGNDGLDKTGE